MKVVRLGRAGRVEDGLDDGKLLEEAMEETNCEVMGRQVMGVKPAIGELGFGPILLGSLENGFTLRDNLEPEQEEELSWKWVSRQPGGIIESYLDTSNRYSDELT